MKTLRTGLIAVIVGTSSYAQRILTLPEAEEKAVRQGYKSRAAYFEQQSTEWERRRVMGTLLPTVNYTLNFLRMDDSTVSRANAMFDGLGSMFESLGPLLGQPGVTGPDLRDNPNRLYNRSFSHEITVSQPIFNGGMEFVSARMAGQARQAARFKRDGEEYGAIFTTRKAYLDAVAARERNLLAQNALDWAHQNYERIKIKHDAGAAPVTELLQWEAEVAQKQSELLMAGAAATVSMLALYQAMGINPANADTAAQLLAVEYFETQFNRNTPALQSAPLDGNPSLLTFAALTRIAEGSKKIAAAQFLPKINAFYSYKWNPWEHLSPNEKTHGWTAGAAAVVPIFSGTRTTAAYHKSRYDLNTQMVREQELRSQLEVNLARVILSYNANHEAVRASRKQMELMELQLGLMQQRYDGGLVNQSQLLEVELGARSSRIGYIQKLFESLMLKSEYELLTGKLEPGDENI